jgi:hypothetical protein
MRAHVYPRIWRFGCPIAVLVRSFPGYRVLAVRYNRSKRSRQRFWSPFKHFRNSFLTAATSSFLWRKAAQTAAASVYTFAKNTIAQWQFVRNSNRLCQRNFFAAAIAPFQNYRASAASMAAVTWGESGVTAGSKRATGLPLRSKRNLVKFHLMSPPICGFSDLSVRKT